MKSQTPFVKSINFKILLLVILTELAVFIPLGIFYTTRFTDRINLGIEQQLNVPGALMRDGSLNYMAVADTATMSTLLGERYVDGFIVGVDRNVYYARNSDQVDKTIDTLEGMPFWRCFDSTGTRSQIRRPNPAGDIVCITPLRRHTDSGLLGFLYLRISTEAALIQKSRLALFFTWGTLVCLLITTVALFYQIRRTITKPVNQVARAMQRFTQGNFSTRTRQTRKDDEIGDLEKGFNTMAQNLEKTVADMVANEQKYRNLVERLSDGLLVIDDQGVIVYANPRMGLMLGLDAAQLCGTPAAACIAVENRQLFKDAILSKATVAGRRFECLLQTPHAVLLTQMSIHSNLEQDGIRRQISLVVTDITESKRVEVEREKIERIESIGLLAGGIAHDFNNMLTAIICNISLIGSAEESAQRQQYLESAEKACFRARDLTRQLLTFAKGGQPIRRLSDVGALIKESLSISLSGSQIKSESTIPADLHICLVDAGQISQVFNNLLINAKQAMPEGGTVFLYADNIACTANSPYKVRAGDYVRITIQDTGVGISAQDLPHIFDPFFTTKDAGNGLGLASSFSIIRKHDGHIAVESVLAKGTTFTILLPAFKDSVAPITPSKGTPGISGQGKILIFDDDQAVAQAVVLGLSARGYTVESFAEGKQAIARYAEALKNNDGFRAVILDLTVPGGFGGKKVLGELKLIDPRVRAIVASGYSNDPILADYRAYGFDAMIQKPFTVDQLSRVLNYVLNAV